MRNKILCKSCFKVLAEGYLIGTKICPKCGQISEYDDSDYYYCVKARRNKDEDWSPFLGIEKTSMEELKKHFYDNCSNLQNKYEFGIFASPRKSSGELIQIL